MYLEKKANNLKLNPVFQPVVPETQVQNPLLENFETVVERKWAGDMGQQSSGITFGSVDLAAF